MGRLLSGRTWMSERQSKHDGAVAELANLDERKVVEA